MSLLFTIIIPTYNRANSISRTIQAVLKQTYSNFEVIIVDDGSIDNTALVVQRLLDPRIRYFYQTNKGVCSARNLGAKNASGKFLVFLDSDDTVSVNWLNDFFESYQLNSYSNVILCGIRYFRNGEMFKEVKASGKPRIPGSFAIEIGLFTLIGGYDERLKFGENTEMFIRISEKNPTVAQVNNINLNYFQSIDGGSKNLVNKIISNEIILNKHTEFYKKNRRGRRLLFQVIGVGYLRLNNYGKAREYLWKAYLLNPLQLKNLIRFWISFNAPFCKLIY